MLTIRNATTQDIPLIRQLADEIWWATYPTILSSDQISYMLTMMYSEESLLKQMEIGHTFLLACDNDCAVGFASYGVIEGRSYKLHKLYIQPNRQGKGVGRFLLDYVLDEILRRGGRTLDLNVNRNNPATFFYEKLGFNVVREEDVDIGDGYWMNDYVMRKRIDA